MSVGAWIRRNVFAVAAVILPLLIVALFMLATLLPRLWVPAPQFDLVFAVQGAPEPVGLDYEVRGDAVYVTAKQLERERLHPRSRLYRFRSVTGTVTAIECPAPSTANELEALLEGLGEGKAQTSLEVLCQEKLIPGKEAPDGYVANAGEYRGSGLFGELFGMRGRRDLLTLEKQGRIVAVAHPDDRNYYYQPVQILGWLEPMSVER